MLRHQLLRRGLNTLTGSQAVDLQKTKNGITTGWITSPGPIAGCGLLVNLNSLDHLKQNARAEDTANSKLYSNELKYDDESNLPDSQDHCSLVPLILEKFAFKRTRKLSASAFTEKLDKLVGMAAARQHKNTVLLSGLVPEYQISDSIAILADIIEGLGEAKDEDIEEFYRILQFEQWDLRQPLRFEDLLTDLAHRAAFNPHRTMVASASSLLYNVSDENKKDKVFSLIGKAFVELQNYWSEIVVKQPQKHLVLVGAGENPAGRTDFFNAVDSKFGSLSESCNNDLPNTEGGYCGGSLVWSSSASPLANISLSLSTPAPGDAATFPLAILQMLLGGGGSFSAGGPGKGMYSRLYTQMLNRYSWLESARVFSVSYNPRNIGGLFGINASCLPEKAPLLIKILLSHLSTHLASSLTSTELNRAKNQVKSALLMGLESRSLQLENFAEQLLSMQLHPASESYLSPAELCERIDRIGVDELQETARKMAKGSKLSLAAYGQTDFVPELTDVEDMFQDQFISKL